MKDLKTSGDLTEKYFFDFIEQRLPTYIKIWERFISYPDKLVKEREKRKKKRLSQLIYTCLDGVVSVKFIIDKHKKGVNLPSIEDEDFIPIYYEMMNDLFLFNAHIGRVSELIRKEIPKILKGMKQSLLQKYFDNRNNIIHSPRIPFYREGEFLTIPKFEGQDQIEAWTHDDKMLWSDVDPNKFQFLSDYIVTTFDNFLIDLEQVFKIILSKIKEIFPYFFVEEAAHVPIQEQPVLFQSGSNADSSGGFNK